MGLAFGSAPPADDGQQSLHVARGASLPARCLGLIVARLPGILALGAFAATYGLGRWFPSARRAASACLVAISERASRSISPGAARPTLRDSGVDAPSALDLYRRARFGTTPSRPHAKPETHERVLVLVMPGADWRAIMSLFPGAHAATVVSLGQRIDGPFPEHITLVDRDLVRSPEAYAIHEAVRRNADEVIARLRELLPPGLRELASTHATALSNHMMMEIDRFIMQVEDAVCHVREVEAERVVILAGDGPEHHIRDGLVGAGLASAAVEIVDAWPGLRTKEAVDPKIALTCPSAPSSTASPDHSALQARFHSICRKFPFLNFRGDCLVLPATNPRHLPAALSLCRRMAVSRPVKLFVPLSELRWSLVRATWAEFVRSRGRVQTRFFLGHQNFSSNVSDARWQSELVSAMLSAGISRLEPHALSFHLGTIQFVERYLIPALAFARKLDAAFAVQPPACVVLVPGTQPFGMIAAGAANSNSIPNGQVQTLLTQPTGREYRPVADIVGVIDTSQAELFARYFGVPADRIVLTGYLDHAEPTAAPSVEFSQHANSSMPDAKYRIAFISQPLAVLCCKALIMVIEAIRADADIALDIYTHPRESARQKMEYLNIIKQMGVADQVRVAGHGTPDSAIEKASLVACLYSNVAIQAAARGKDVLVLAPEDVQYPCEMAEMGIALRSTSREQTEAAIEVLRRRGSIAEMLDASRQRYFLQNVQLVSDIGTDRLIARLGRHQQSPGAMNSGKY